MQWHKDKKNKLIGFYSFKFDKTQLNYFYISRKNYYQL